MRGYGSVVMVLAAIPLVSAASAPAPVRIAPATFVEWAQDKGTRAWTAGGVTAMLAARGPAGAKVPVLTVSAPGMASLTIVNSDSSAHYASHVAIGPLTAGGPTAVILQTYTGGAHCCVHVAVGLPVGKAFRTVDLGVWDGDEISWPRDVSGDGVADFVFRDNAFLYAFGSYAGSYPPPTIRNILGGKAVDVSTVAAFRPLFRADMAESRKACVAETSLNGGACAGYAADAARLGQLDRVWPQVVKAARSGLEWPDACSEEPRPRPCFATYHSALRAFLRKHGYVR